MSSLTGFLMSPMPLLLWPFLAMMVIFQILKIYTERNKTSLFGLRTGGYNFLASVALVTFIDTGLALLIVSYNLFWLLLGQPTRFNTAVHSDVDLLMFFGTVACMAHIIWPNESHRLYAGLFSAVLVSTQAPLGYIAPQWTWMMMLFIAFQVVHTAYSSTINAPSTSPKKTTALKT